MAKRTRYSVEQLGDGTIRPVSQRGHFEGPRRPAKVGKGESKGRLHSAPPQYSIITEREDGMNGSMDPTAHDEARRGDRQERSGHCMDTGNLAGARIPS